MVNIRTPSARIPLQQLRLRRGRQKYAKSWENLPEMGAITAAIGGSEKLLNFPNIA